MKTKRKSTKGQNRNKSSVFISFPFIALVILIAAALLFFLWHQKRLQQTAEQQAIFSQDLTDEIAVPEQVDSKPSALPSQSTASTDVQSENKASAGITGSSQESAKLSNDDSDLQKAQDSQSVSKNNAQKTGEASSDVSTTATSDKPNKTFQSVRCQETTRFIEDFFKHLDKQQYLQKYSIEPDSKTYFIALMQKILDNPPVVSGETDDLYTILQNTAHFFRILGNTNIVILKNILSNEKSQFENIAAKFYTLITSQECAEQNFGLKISKPALYEYAGFFLNTMGGRLYLFRRDSISRMVISYYSILLIDKANIESFNKHGIELSTSIDLLISEMESTTNTLKLKDTYLNTLYALQEQYQ